jgi:hypothetical protein
LILFLDFDEFLLVPTVTAFLFALTAEVESFFVFFFYAGKTG